MRLLRRKKPIVIGRKTGLLDEIQRMALDEDMGLNGLLRRCLVLASTLGHEPLRQWVSWELNGYDHAKDLPDYRRTTAAIRVNAHNGVWSMTGHEYPIYAFPDNLQEDARRVNIYWSVSELESLKNRDELHLSLPPHVRFFIEHNLQNGYGLTGAYFELSLAIIHGILSVVRTRILEFTLSLAKDYPQVNVAAPGSHPVPLDVVNERFQLIIMGNNNAVSFGSHNITTAGNNNIVIKGNINSLKEALREQGLEEEDLDALEELLEEHFDEASLKRGEGRLGTWANSKAGKVARGGGSLLKDFALNMIVALIMQYTYGGGGQSGKN